MSQRNGSAKVTRLLKKIDRRAYDAAAAVAKRLGYVQTTGRGAKRTGSVRLLVEAIGRGDVVVEPAGREG